MRYRTLALVAIRVVGIYLLAKAGPDFVQTTAFSLYDRFITSSGNAGFWIRWGGPILVALRLAVALYLTFGGRALLSLVFPSTHAYCPTCGHDAGVGEIPAICPECGFAAQKRASTEPTP